MRVRSSTGRRQGGPVLQRGVCVCLVRGGGEASEKPRRRRSRLCKTCRGSDGAPEASPRQGVEGRRPHEAGQGPRRATRSGGLPEAARRGGGSEERLIADF